MTEEDDMQVTKNEGQNGLPMKNIERILVNLPTREWLGVIEVRHLPCQEIRCTPLCGGRHS